MQVLGARFGAPLTVLGVARVAALHVPAHCLRVVGSVGAGDASVARRDPARVAQVERQARPERVGARALGAFKLFDSGATAGLPVFAVS